MICGAELGGSRKAIHWLSLCSREKRHPSNPNPGFARKLKMMRMLAFSSRWGSHQLAVLDETLVQFVFQVPLVLKMLWEWWKRTWRSTKSLNRWLGMLAVLSYLSCPIKLTCYIIYVNPELTISPSHMQVNVCDCKNACTIGVYVASSQVLWFVAFWICVAVARNIYV